MIKRGRGRGVGTGIPADAEPEMEVCVEQIGDDMRGERTFVARTVTYHNRKRGELVEVRLAYRDRVDEGFQARRLASAQARGGRDGRMAAITNAIEAAHAGAVRWCNHPAEYPPGWAVRALARFLGVAGLPLVRGTRPLLGQPSGVERLLPDGSTLLVPTQIT